VFTTEDIAKFSLLDDTSLSPVSELFLIVYSFKIFETYLKDQPIFICIQLQPILSPSAETDPTVSSQ
jgi:hypothetical protein